MSFIKVASIDEIEPGTGKEFTVGDTEIVVLRSDEGDFHAMAKECPHAGFSMVDGIIEDGCVECVAHGAQFDLETGAPQSPAHDPLKIYPVQIADGSVAVDVEA
nr:Rieske 2Fe-2S domain-containing protein [Mobiluncus sp. Marseille-Q7826]